MTTAKCGILRLSEPEFLSKALSVQKRTFWRVLRSWRLSETKNTACRGRFARLIWPSRHALAPRLNLERAWGGAEESAPTLYWSPSEIWGAPSAVVPFGSPERGARCGVSPEGNEVHP